MADIKQLADPSELQDVVSTDGLAIVEATTADEDAATKELRPTIEKLARKYNEARWCRFDAQVSSSIAESMAESMGQTPQLPVFCLYVDGSVMESVSGVTKGALEEAIQKYYKGKVSDDDED